MADQILLSAAKSSSLRSTRSNTSSSWTNNWKQAQNEEHLIQGYSPSGLSRYRSLLQFNLGSMAGVTKILKAELHLFSTTDHSGIKTIKTSKANLKVAVKPTNWTSTGGGESLWNGALPTNGAEDNDSYRATGLVKDVNLSEAVLNVMPLVRYWAPKTVKDNTGKACLGKSNYGMVLSAVTGTSEVVVASDHHVNTSIRPFLVLTVELKGGPGVTVQTGPVGDIPSGIAQFFRGEYEPGVTGDKMVAVTIKRTGGGLPDAVWTTKPSNTDVATSTFAVPVPASWPLLTSFTWAAQVKNTRGVWTPWSGTLPVRWTGTPPSLTLPQPTGVTLDSLVSVSFRVRATIAAKKYRAARWRVQLRTETTSSDPTWGDDVLWDTGPMTVPLTRAEKSPATTTVVQNLRVTYGGPALEAGPYSWRVQAEDVFGALSPWLYGSLTVGSTYVPQPGEIINLTGYAKEPPFRIRIFGMGTLRGPGKLLAELTDAANVGASEFYNSAGEFFFTLPATHPQAPVIEPYQCHYALEEHTEEGWRGKAYGLITDFDASEDETVFYGTDYLGLLARSVEERFSPVDAELTTDKGGAKYAKKTISYIITDQLNKAKAMPNSPVGFISVGDIAPISEQVTIYASFKQRLGFISGLIESARAGTGRRTRLVCERAANGTFRWRLLIDPGLNRPNLRMEYGGLVQGFRTVPFGNWGTAVAAVGRTIAGVKVYSALATAPGISETTYGHWPSLAMYADLDDLNDLRRRAAQAATRESKVGKQMGIGLRVGSIGIKDGYDICDSIPVDIKRGNVDTTRFGSGYWTIWGWTWNSYADGHSALVLSLAPREDTTPPNPDLIPSKPIFSKDDDWVVKAGPPTADPETFTGWPLTYIDSTTGHIYKYSALMDTGDLADPAPYENITLAMAGNPIMPSTGGGEGNLEDPYYPEDYRPVSVVPSLPTLPDEKYPDGSTVSLDGTLYTNHAGVWETAEGSGTPGPPGPPGPPGADGVADTVPPPEPVILSVEPQPTALNVDGSSMTNFLIHVGYTVPPVGLTDLDAFMLESTRFPRLDDTSLPDWTRATTWVSQSEDALGAVSTPIVQPNVVAAESYWMRVYAIDKAGNRSIPSATVTALSTEDDTAPPSPTGIVVEAGMSTIGLRWDDIQAADFSHVDVGWRVAPDGNWTTVQVGGTLVVITGLTNGVAYDLRLRSVDWSNNTVQVAGADPPVTVKATDPDAGWVNADPATPQALPGSALVWDEAMIAALFAGNINADWITAGTLKVGGAPDSAAAIEVYNADGELVGRWSDTGIEVLDPDNPNYKLAIAESSLHIFDITDPAQPFSVVAITPLGIDASSITFGSARGGHNLVANSSFELGAFSATNIVNSVWDTSTDWNAANSRQGADVNLTTYSTVIQMTTVT